MVLVDDDGARLTEWMMTNMRVSWCAYPAPREVEAATIRMLRPPPTSTTPPDRVSTSSRPPVAGTTEARAPVRAEASRARLTMRDKPLTWM